MLLGCDRESKVLLEKPLLKVNQTELTAQEFGERLARQLKPFDALAAKDPNNINNAKKGVIRNFLVEVITQDWAKKNDVFIKKEALEAEVRRIRNSYPDDIAFRRALAEEGLTLEFWQEKIRYSLLQKAVVEKLKTGQPEPTESDVSAYFEANKKIFDRPEQIRIRQVVLDNEDSAKQILSEIKKGRDLAEIAKKFSIAPEAKVGGEVGWIERGTLAIFDKGFNMGRGQTSPILKSPFGFHIFQVLERRPPAKANLATARPIIMMQLREAREQELYLKWLDQQIRAARVFKNDVAIDNISVETRVQ